MQRLRWGLALAALVMLAMAGWALTAGMAPCRWIDRLTGASGCAGWFRIDDLAMLRRGVAFRPGAPDTLVVGGVTLGGQGRLSSRIVLYDLGRRREVARYLPDPSGVIEHLTIAPDGRHLALTCNRLHACDTAPMHRPEDIESYNFIPVGLIDLERWDDRRDGLRGPPGQGWWVSGLSARQAPPDADGAAIDLRFRPDGQVLQAGPAAWRVEDGSRLPPSDPAPSLPIDRNRLGMAPPGGEVQIRHDDGRLWLTGAGVVPRLDLSLPPGFIAERYPAMAVSPDGTRLALLSRRFAGQGRPAAILQIWRLADGTRLLRRAVAERLAAPLLWTPDGDMLLVALAAPQAPRAATEFRLYSAP